MLCNSRSKEITLRAAPEVSKALLVQRYVVARTDDFDVYENFYDDWKIFRNSWENLACDPYLPDRGSYRSRRYSRFSLDRLTLALSELPHRSYFQSAEHNRVSGGRLRSFESLEEYIRRHKILRDIIVADAELLWAIDNDQTRLHIDVHQIRITATQEEKGDVVPEGIHQDGLDFIATHLVERANVAGGVSSIYDLNKRLLSSFTLEKPLDVFYAFDKDVMHDASPIRVEGENSKSHRDTLLIGFKSIEEHV